MVLEYELWRNEPTSVEERRGIFLREMGFNEPCSSFDRNEVPMKMVLERTMEQNEAVLSSCSSSSFDCESECNGNSADECKDDDYDDLSRQNLVVCDDDEPSTSKIYKSLNKRIRHWWKEMMMKTKCKDNNEKFNEFEESRVKVQVSKKKFKELSAVFVAQEIRAHDGIIWTMKFSPDGKYLATGGEDGVVRVWRVMSVDSYLKSFSDDNTKIQAQKKVNNVRVVVPDKRFKIEEMPVQEFYGHDADVLDLAWSNDSNLLLSSSMDKTVRLWQLGSNTCLNTFHHTDYVTCVQFNPIDNLYFISGSIDGKVRIWGVSKRRVLDWADIRDAVTAVCYQPDGQGFVVGSLSGSCHFYETNGEFFELSANILLSSKRSSVNRITGLQFSPEDSYRVMVTSEDSKVRILDKMDVVYKFRAGSVSQMSASFTTNGRHIVSIGQADSHVYIWNHENPIELSTRHTKSTRSCEHFFSEGVSVAVPWCGTQTLPKDSDSGSTEYEGACAARDPYHFSLTNVFSSKSSAIWPEDMLPVFTEPEPEDHCSQARNKVAHSPAWGLVIVTANWDGIIRTFHNYGLPLKV